MTPLCLAPGPTKVHPELPQWLEEAHAEGALWRSHRSSWFSDLYAQVKGGLRELLDIPAGHEIAFTSSANEVWERSIESLVREHSFHVVGGEFAQRWKAYSTALARRTSAFEHTHEYAGDFADLDVPEEAEAICLTQNETSIGFWIPEGQVHALADRYPGKLMLVDVVSGAPHTRLDWSKVDLGYWSVQKGFCLPAGLGVTVIGPRAVERAKELRGRLPTTGAYHSIDRLAANAEKLQTAETPNVLGVYLLSCAVRKYAALGAQRLRAETEARADAVYGRLQETRFKPLVTSTRYQSPTVIAIQGEPDVEPFRKRLIAEDWVYLGACYGDLKPVGLRIANFPSHTREDHARAIDLLH